MFKYADSHEWASPEGKEVKIGISEYAAEHLGDVIYADLPAVGKTVAKGEKLCDLESVKAVAEVFAPIGGKVIAVNTKVGDNASLINESPQGEGWIVMLEASDPSELEALMDEAAYQAFLSTQH